MLPALLLALGGPAPTVDFDFRLYPLGGAGTESRAADLDGDGLLELIAIHEDASDVVVLRQTAPREFGEPVLTPTLDQPTQLALGDFDGDGDVDVAVANGASRLQVLLNDGQGTLAGLAPVPMIASALDLEAFDVDGDGAQEPIAVTETNTSGTQVFPGWLVVVRDATTPGLTRSDEYSLNAFATSIAIGDADDDGEDELIHGYTSANGFQVWEREGDGRLVKGPILGTGDEGTWGRLEDVDGDGRVELVEDYLGMHWVWTLGAYPSIRVLETFNAGGRGRYADFDGDGDPDRLLVGLSQFTPTSFRLYLLDDAATLTYGPSQLLGNGGPWNSAQGVADLDADGRPDVFSTALDAARAEVSWNDGPPPVVQSFEPTVLPALSPAGGVLTIQGAHLDRITGGSIAGVPLAVGGACDPDDVSGCTTIVSPERLEIVPPPLAGAASGSVPLVLSYSQGALDLELPTETSSTPTLVSYDQDSSLAAGSVATLHSGGVPGGVRLLLASTDPTPSSLPGLVELEIGAGFYSLTLISTVTLDADGLALDALTVPPAAAGVVLLVETVVVDPQQPVGPFPTSDVLSLVLGP